MKYVDWMSKKVYSDSLVKEKDTATQDESSIIIAKLLCCRYCSGS